MYKAMKKLMVKLSSRRYTVAVTMMNALAMMIVIHNMNAACVWLDHQPEVPDEAKSFRKF